MVGSFIVSCIFGDSALHSEPLGNVNLILRPKDPSLHILELGIHNQLYIIFVLIGPDFRLLNNFNQKPAVII